MGPECDIPRCCKNRAGVTLFFCGGNDMRFPMILMAVAGTLVLGGCDNPALISMEPAVSEQETVFDASLLEAGRSGRATTFASCAAATAVLTPSHM